MSTRVEIVPVVRTEAGDVVYPDGCSPTLIRGNNYVISARFDVSCRPVNPLGGRFSVFRRCAPCQPIGRLDLWKTMAPWQTEQFCEGHVGARIRSVLGTCFCGMFK